MSQLTNTQLTQFIVGKKYYHGFENSSSMDCGYIIVKRTAHTLWIENLPANSSVKVCTTRKKVHIFDSGEEYVYPGNAHCSGASTMDASTPY